MSDPQPEKTMASKVMKGDLWNTNTMLPNIIVQRWWTVISVCKHKPEVVDPLHASNPLLWSELVNHPLLQINCHNGRYFTDKFYKHLSTLIRIITFRVRTLPLPPLPTAYIHKTRTFKRCLFWLFKWFLLTLLDRHKSLVAHCLEACLRGKWWKLWLRWWICHLTKSYNTDDPHHHADHQSCWLACWS